MCNALYCGVENQQMCHKILRKCCFGVSSSGRCSCCCQETLTGQENTSWTQLEWVWWSPSILLPMCQRRRPCRASSDPCLTGTGTLNLQWPSPTWGTTKTALWQHDRNNSCLYWIQFSVFIQMSGTFQIISAKACVCSVFVRNALFSDWM